MKLYTNNEKVIRSSKQNLIEFLMSFLDETPRTYYDEECTDKQCCAKANRSFYDIVYLCKTYFDCTTEDVATEIIKLINTDKYSAIHCPDISKIIFFARKNRFWVGLNNRLFDTTSRYYIYRKIIREKDYLNFNDLFALSRIKCIHDTRENTCDKTKDRSIETTTGK